eukprot:548466_1
MGIFAETIMGLLVHLVGTFLLAYFVFSLFKNVLCSGIDRNAKGDSLLFWGSVVCIFLFAIRAFCGFLFFIIIAAKGESHSPLIDELLDISWPCYGLALWIMLLCFVFRINFNFTGNYVSYPRSIIIFLYFGVVLTVTNTIVLSIIIVFDLWIAIGGLWILYWVIGWYLIYTVSLVYLLFRKVFVLLRIRYKQIINYSKNDAKELETINNLTDDIVDDAQDDVIDVISLDGIKNAIRFALLICIGIISTYISVVLAMIDLELLLSQNEHIPTWTVVFQGIDLIVNALVVYLMFTFTTYSYRKCCGICDKCVETCCLRCMLSFNANDENQADTQQYATLVLSN